jgi:hypothetical protein
MLCATRGKRIQKKEPKEDERGEGSSAFFSPSEKLSMRRSL